MASFSETAGKSITCKAAVMWGTDDKTGNADLSVEDVIVAPPKAGEVRIKIISTAVCHTDLYNKSGKDSETNLPCILGHEGIGVVESVGEGVTDVAVGDTIIPLYTPECRECLFCKATGAKRNNLCAKIRATQGKGLMPDGTTRFSIVKDGVTTPVFHFMGVSSFSEYCVCAAISLAKVPSTIDPERGCLFGCGLTTGFGSVVNNAKFEAGSTAAVFGLGAVGLAVVLGLKEAGASRIIAVDTNPAKYDKAKEIFPAIEFVNPKAPEHEGKKIQDIIVAMTTREGFGGVDYSFECVGNTDLMGAALESTHRAWGKSVVIGVAEAGKELHCRPFFLVVGRQWTGSAYGGVKGRTELPGIIDRLLPQVGGFITHRYKGVGQINDAIHVMHDPAACCIRPVITL